MRPLANKPLMIDLYCGLGGWAEGGLAEGYDIVGFDIERHVYGDHRYPAQLVLQDVLTLHGSQFRDAALIVASPPCQAYSYRAMPWKRAKALPPPDNTLFEACFRIQREACEAAGRHIPLIVENVRGAQKWVGRAQCHVGPFYFWGDVPVLMPPTCRRKQSGDPSWFYENYETSARRFGSKSPERKQWSAEIAKIPPEISTWVARYFYPREQEMAGVMAGRAIIKGDSVSHDRLLELLHYDPDSGIFTWKVRKPNGVSVGGVAGRIEPTRGYARISIDNREYRAHRLAWFYVHGVWPHPEIDHINRDRTDNRLVNLRIATRLINNRNRSPNRNRRSTPATFVDDRSSSKW